MRQGIQLDIEGKGAEARTAFQKEIDTASTPAAKANAERAMAMSWAFEGDCRKTLIVGVISRGCDDSGDQSPDWARGLGRGRVVGLKQVYCVLLVSINKEASERGLVVLPN